MPPPAPIPIGRSVFVSTLGDDKTGQRERLDRCFASPIAAVAAAQAGDTVFVFPGEYPLASTLQLNKRISLKLLGQTRLFGEPIEIYTSEAVSLEGGMIHSPGGTPLIVNSGIVTVRDCTIQTDATSNQDAILLGGSKSSLLLENCYVLAAGGTTGTDAIGMDNGWLVLNDCRVVSEGANGLTVRNAGRVSLYDCDITGNDSALVADEALVVESEGCYFRCSGIGAAVKTAGHGNPKIHLRGGEVYGLPFSIGNGEITVAGTVWDRTKGMPGKEWIPGAGWK